MLISMFEIGGAEVLAGALEGQRVQRKLLEQCSGEKDTPEIVLLDFARVELATASFLREAVVESRDMIRRRRSNFYPVVANANDAVREELEEVLRARGGAIMACRTDIDGAVRDLMLVGMLEPKQKLTFSLVETYGETGASELNRAYQESEKNQHATAWNNRLASLAALGLVMEISNGRTKTYRALAKEVGSGR